MSRTTRDLILNAIEGSPYVDGEIRPAVRALEEHVAKLEAEIARLREQTDIANDVRCTIEAFHATEAALGRAVVAVRNHLHSFDFGWRDRTLPWCPNMAPLHDILADAESAAAGEYVRAQQDAIETLRRLVNHSSTMAPGFSTARREAIDALEKLDAFAAVDARRGGGALEYTQDPAMGSDDVNGGGEGER